MTAPLPRRPGPTARRRVVEVLDGNPLSHEDRLAVEEPLEIRLDAPGLPPRRIAVTMRTPGHDFELAAGWLVHEGVVEPEAISAVRYCTDESLLAEQEFNVVTVTVDQLHGALPASRTVTSACGVCGADSVREVTPGSAAPLHASLSLTQLQHLPEEMRSRQRDFVRTGALHAAGLFDQDLSVVAVREDVGRHNAVDKVVGSRVLARQPVPPVLVLSGRVAFELVQKAVTSGVRVIVAVGAPTSLAVRLAEEADLTLVGFARPDRCVVYSGGHRVGV